MLQTKILPIYKKEREKERKKTITRAEPITGSDNRFFRIPYFSALFVFGEKALNNAK